MGFLRRRAEKKAAAACVQTARDSTLLGAMNGYVPLRGAEHRLYEQVRAAVPMIDAALQKIVRLTGGFALECDDKAAQVELERFRAEVKTGACRAGLDAFLERYLDDLLTYGGAAGEIVLTCDGREVYGLYNTPLENLEVLCPETPMDARFYVRTGMGRREAENQGLILYSALNPPAGEVRGVSLLRGLPFIGEVLLRIYECIGKNFERVGNVRFAVTCKPDEAGLDPVAARETAEAIAREWSEAMAAQSAGSVRDFVAVGDVAVKTIGADNQMLDTKAPVDQMLQQIVAKLGLPPFLLGLSWSTTERMSRQQADMLTSELEAYRRLLTPVIQRICGVYLALMGKAAEVRVNWDCINLQDEVEAAQAKLLLAQAENAERKSV